MKKYLIIIAAFLLCVSCATTGSGKLKYVELHVRECGICNRMIPVIEAVQKKYSKQVDVETYGGSSETGEDLAEQYKVKRYPANLFFDADGKLFFRYEGLLDQRSVEEILNNKIKTMPVTETAK